MAMDHRPRDRGCGWMAASGAAGPIVVYDARAIWTLHSLFIYGGHNTYLAALKESSVWCSNPDYPPLVSASGAIGLAVDRGSDLHLAVSLTSILNACALGVAGCGIASIPGKNISPPWTRPSRSVGRSRVPDWLRRQRTIRCWGQRRFAVGSECACRHHLWPLATEIIEPFGDRVDMRHGRQSRRTKALLTTRDPGSHVDPLYPGLLATWSCLRWSSRKPI